MSTAIPVPISQQSPSTQAHYLQPTPKQTLVHSRKLSPKLLLTPRTLSFPAGYDESVTSTFFDASEADQTNLFRRQEMQFMDYLTQRLLTKAPLSTLALRILLGKLPQRAVFHIDLKTINNSRTRNPLHRQIYYWPTGT